jgi:hypothetical protein
MVTGRNGMHIGTDLVEDCIARNPVSPDDNGIDFPFRMKGRQLNP